MPDEENIIKTKKQIEPFIYDYIRNVKGSISAEHGLGQLKHNYLNYSKDQTSIDYMKAIK